MELSVHQSFPPFIKNSKVFLSTEEAHTFLEKKKIALPDQRDVSFNDDWRVTAHALVLFSILGATLALLSVSNKQAHIDHSDDNVTDLQFIKSPFSLPLDYYERYLQQRIIFG